MARLHMVMRCRKCGGQGHNKRTCRVGKSDEGDDVPEPSGVTSGMANGESEVATTQQSINNATGSNSRRLSRIIKIMPQVKIIAKNFMDMVASLLAMKLNKLYDNSFICEAILRSLPPLAKKYVLQMLCIEGSVTAKQMKEWVLLEVFSMLKIAIARLIQLRVFTETVDRKKETSYKLNPTFQTNLQKHLIYGGVLPREPMPSNITVRLPSLEDHDAYSLEQWEYFTLQLISPGQAETPTNKPRAS